MTVQADIQKLNPEGSIGLYELHFPSARGYVAGTGVDDVLYFTPYTDRGNYLVYNTQQYKWVDCALAGIKETLESKVTEANLEINTQWMPLLMAVNTFKDLRGARLIQHIVFKSYLDGGANAGNVIQRRVFYLNGLDEQTKNSFTFSCTYSLGLGRNRPNNSPAMSSGRCALKYRRYDSNSGTFTYIPVKDGGCPWGNPSEASNWNHLNTFGTPLFREDGTSTTNPAEDECPLTLSGCAQRFLQTGQEDPLPIKATFRKGTNFTGGGC